MTALGELALASAASNSATTPAPESMQSDVPTIETAAYRRSVSRWTKVRDVFQGTEAIRAGTTLYLPQFTGESSSLYDARRTIAALFNGYARTVLAAVGLLSDPEPVLGKDMPQALVDLAENVDGAGTHLAVLTQQLAKAAMIDGFTGLLTEYPRPNDPRIDRSKASLAATLAIETGGELDAADVQALGLRPYFIILKADEVLPVYETVNGKRTLVLFIRKETVTERKGRFGLETVTRYRVYELQKNGSVTYERWSVASQGGTPACDEGPTLMKNLKGIPWSPLVAGEKLGENEYKPTLLDLADLTLTHHRIATGILSLEEQACVLTMVAVGRSRNDDGEFDDIHTGPANVIDVPAGEGMPAIPVYYLDVPVDVLDPAMKSLETCKREMSTMGASFLAPDAPAQKTATESRIDASADRATISSVSRALQDCLESAFGFAGQYLGETAGSVAVNRDFTGEGIDPQAMANMTAAYQAGGVSLEEYRYFLQKGELPETFKPEDTAAVLAQFAPPSPNPPDPNADPNAP